MPLSRLPERTQHIKQDYENYYYTFFLFQPLRFFVSHASDRDCILHLKYSLQFATAYIYVQSLFAPDTNL